MNERNSQTKIAEYSELIQRLTLVNIIIPKMDFALSDGLTLPQMNYKAKISRSQVELGVEGDQLKVKVGFQIQGINQGKEIFNSHFHFLIVFKHDNKDELEKLIEHEEIRKTLTGSQTDKLVWSYLRRSLLQAVVDAGLPPIVLPLYK